MSAAGEGDGDEDPTEAVDHSPADSAPNATVVDRPGARGRVPRPSAPPADEPVADDLADDAPARRTVVDTPGAVDGEPSRTGTASTASTTSAIGSPLEALSSDEITRTKHFTYVGMVIGMGALIALPLLPGTYVTTRLLAGSIALAFLGLAYLLHRTRDPATFEHGIGVAIGWYIPCLGVTAAVPYFGPFSAVVILLVLGIYFTSLGRNRALAVALYATCALVEGVTCTLVITGAMKDPGIIHANYLAPRHQLLCGALIQLVLAGTFAIARASRSSSLAAIGALERAVRAVAQREALLQEARDELRRAVGSGRGRFTDQTIGRFKLGDLIGRGAMGEVYEAADPQSSQTVAVKLLSQASLGNAHYVQRFLRELQTATTLESPNVVRVIEVGEHPLPHLVMERLRGQDLASILRGKRALSHAKIADLIRQIAAGITVAGAAGIIHRDLKPQNVFLAGATWKILDFGVSRLADTGDTLTSGHVVGTPTYMAPEQARGDAVDHRTDLYAVAAIAYRTLTGQPLFVGGEIAETLYRVVHTAPRRPASLATLHDDVDLVLAIGLAKDPADRFATGPDLAEALAAALGGTLDETTRRRGRALVRAGAWTA